MSEYGCVWMWLGPPFTVSTLPITADSSGIDGELWFCLLTLFSQFWEVESWSCPQSLVRGCCSYWDLRNMVQCRTLLWYWHWQKIKKFWIIKKIRQKLWLSIMLKQLKDWWHHLSAGYPNWHCHTSIQTFRGFLKKLCEYRTFTSTTWYTEQ